jgi:hypothetical protein
MPLALEIVKPSPGNADKNDQGSDLDEVVASQFSVQSTENSKFSAWNLSFKLLIEQL